jgi:hypothetical protein
VSYHRLEPIDPRDAFTVTAREEDPASWSVAASQAALLLAIRAGVLGDVPTTEKLDEFPLPNVRRLEKELLDEEEPALEQEMTRLIRELYRRPCIEAAAALFEAAMFSPHRLVAVAAAAGARETTRLRPRIRQALEKGYASDDSMTSRLAVAAMSQMPPLQELAREQVVRQPKSRKRRRESDTAVITHGTWAADSAWYRPGGDFYEAVKASRPDLHVHDESFRWTGAYSKRARKADARLLQQWIADQGLGTPDLFAHSHGATVANLATWRGVEFERLVLLSWPVHREWYPKFANVKKIVDVRVHLDLVIMADRGRQRFKSRSSQVKTHRNGWFNHSATHEPDYWDDHELWDKV